MVNTQETKRLYFRHISENPTSGAQRWEMSKDMEQEVEAWLEEEYGHGIKKLTRASLSEYSSNENRAGCVVPTHTAPTGPAGPTCSKTRTP